MKFLQLPRSIEETFSSARIINQLRNYQLVNSRAPTLSSCCKVTQQVGWTQHTRLARIKTRIWVQIAWHSTHEAAQHLLRRKRAIRTQTSKRTSPLFQIIFARKISLIQVKGALEGVVGCRMIVSVREQLHRFLRAPSDRSHTNTL